MKLIKSKLVAKKIEAHADAWAAAIPATAGAAAAAAA